MPEDVEPRRPRPSARTPASWITLQALAEQRAALPALAWERYHCGRWTAREGAAFAAGAWQACIGAPRFEPGERVWAGLDVGGSRADTALTWINEARHVGVEVWEGDEGILHAIDAIRELRGRYRVECLAFDPWRAQQAALELERDGLLCVIWPQTDARACPASETLYARSSSSDSPSPSTPSSPSTPPTASSATHAEDGASTRPHAAPTSTPSSRS